MSDDDDDAAIGHASWAVLQALMIVLTERGRVEGEDLREALDEAADFQSKKAAETGSTVHRRVARRLQEMVRDIYAADRFR